MTIKVLTHSWEFIQSMAEYLGVKTHHLTSTYHNPIIELCHNPHPYPISHIPYHDSSTKEMKVQLDVACMSKYSTTATEGYFQVQIILSMSIRYTMIDRLCVLDIRSWRELDLLIKKYCNKCRDVRQLLFCQKVSPIWTEIILMLCWIAWSESRPKESNLSRTQRIQSESQQFPLLLSPTHHVLLVLCLLSFHAVWVSITRTREHWR